MRRGVRRYAAACMGDKYRSRHLRNPSFVDKELQSSIYYTDTEEDKGSVLRNQEGAVLEETEITTVSETGLTAGNIKTDYLDVVYQDIVDGGQVYALPLGIDTLVMYYNRELLSYASLAQPPMTWNDFVTASSRIAIVNEEDSIVRAAAALGTYENIPRASDIVTLLMMQNGEMMSSGNSVLFNQPLLSDATYFPGEAALQFYTDFATPQKSAYTWNAEMPDALDYFAEGNLAFFFGYRYQEAEIQSKSRGIDYAIAPVPQVNPSSPVNVANYWVHGSAAIKVRQRGVELHSVCCESKVRYLVPQRNAAGERLRTILNTQLQDADMLVTAQQALTAKTWYQGKTPALAEEQFADMIKLLYSGSMEDCTLLVRYVV